MLRRLLLDWACFYAEMSARHVSRRQRHRRWIIEALLIVLVLGIGVAAVVASSSSPSRRNAQAPAPHSDGDVSARDSGVQELSTTVLSTTVPSTSTSTTNPDEKTGLFATPAIDDYLQAQDSDINAAVYNVDTGLLSLYRPGALEYTASIVKVDILAALLHQGEQQGTRLSDEEQNLATAMIENSDDDAATNLWTDIGQQTGLASFDSLIPLPDTVSGTDGHWGGTTTTGADQVDLLRELVLPSRLLEQSAQSYELGLSTCFITHRSVEFVRCVPFCRSAGRSFETRA